MMIYLNIKYCATPTLVPYAFRPPCQSHFSHQFSFVAIAKMSCFEVSTIVIVCLREKISICWFLNMLRLQMRALLIYLVFRLSASDRTGASLLDLPLLSSGYEIEDYIASQYVPDGPWILSSSADSIEQHLLPTINIDYSPTSTLGHVNHVKNQFANAFIADEEDNAHNSLLNSETIQSSGALSLSEHDVEKCTHHHVIPAHTPFGYKKRPIASRNGQCIE